MITISSVSNIFPRGPVVSGLLAFALLCPVGLHAQVSFIRGDANVDASVDLSDGVNVPPGDPAGANDSDSQHGWTPCRLRQTGGSTLDIN